VAVTRIMRLVMRVAVTVGVVPVSVTAELECREAESGRHQQAANNRVLRTLDGRAELQPDSDDCAAEDQREQDMGDGGKQ